MTSVPTPSSPAMLLDKSRSFFVYVSALIILAVMLSAISALITNNRDFALDDAYITYIYGQNLAEGYGIRYNIADANPTEGGSSMLHIVLVAGGALLKIDPLTFTRGAGIAGYGLMTLLLVYFVGRVALVGRAIAAASAVTASFALLYLTETIGHLTKGMETMFILYLHGAFFCWAVFFALSDRHRGMVFNLIGLLIGALLVLARPEGFVLCAGILGAAFMARLYALERFQFVRVIVEIAPIALGLVLFVGLYFAWKISYFGDIFPTAYWVKSNNNIYGSAGSQLPGLKHVVGFLTFRWLPLAAVVLSLLWVAGGRRISLICAILVLPSLCVALLYSRAIHEVTGGFRYGFPLTAPLFCIGALALGFYAGKARAHVPATYLAGICGLFLFTVTPYHPALRAIQGQGIGGWIDYQPTLTGVSPLAEDLAATGLGAEATILTSAAGVIPFLSDFNTIDWLGLNDEQLSGKYEMTIDEVRAYIDAKAPDVAMSIFPAASTGVARFQDDPGFNSNSVRSTLRGRGVRLFNHWDKTLVSDMIWSQMEWFRDDTDLVACYPLRQNWAIFVYVARSSPHYSRLVSTFEKSSTSGCDPERIREMYNVEPRRPIRAFQTSAG